MTSTWRCTTFRLSCLLGAAVALSQTSSSLAQNQAKAAGVPAAKQPAGSAADAKTTDGKRPLNDPLIKRFGEVTDKVDDLKPGEKSTVRRILEGADPLLTRIRLENRRAIQQANRPVRLRGLRPKRVAVPTDQAGATAKKADAAKNQPSATVKKADPSATKPTPVEKVK